MKSFFGFNQTAQFKEALNKTVQKFENMPASEVLALARKHANGDIAQFSKNTQNAQ